MDRKIYIDEKTGSIYWKHADTEEIAYAPMSTNNTCNLQEGGIVDVWNSKADELRIKNVLEQI